MSRDLFRKKISIGVSLHSMTLEEWENILKRYNDVLYDVYFSPPIGDKYHSRFQIANEFRRPEGGKNLLRALELTKEYGVNVELAINAVRMNEDDARRAIEWADKHVKYDSIVTYNHLADTVREYHDDKMLVYAYNNQVKTMKDIDAADPRFQQIVFGISTIRDLRLMQYANDKGFEVRYMPNNGCTFGCAGCGNDTCDSSFERSLQLHTVEDLYAMQSIFPWELHKYIVNNPNAQIIKLSTRPSDYRVLRWTLDSYIHNLNKDVWTENPNFARYLWGRMGHFSRDVATFDYDRMTEYKQKLWERSLAQLEKYNNKEDNQNECIRVD